MLGLFLHFVVQALIQARETLILVLARVDEVLVARRQFAAQQLIQAVDDLGVALHGEEFLRNK